MCMENMLNDLMCEMYAQPAWAAHCYAFEFLPEYSDQIAKYLEGTGEKDEAVKLMMCMKDASDEYERIASSDHLSFMRPEDTEKLEGLDRQFLKEVCHAAQMMVRSLGITDEYLTFETGA